MRSLASGMHLFENEPKLSISLVLNIVECFSNLNISFLATFFQNIVFDFRIRPLGQRMQPHDILSFSEVWDGLCIVWDGLV